MSEQERDEKEVWLTVHRYRLAANTMSLLILRIPGHKETVKVDTELKKERKRK